MLQRCVSRLSHTHQPHHSGNTNKKFSGPTTAPHCHANNKTQSLTAVPCCKRTLLPTKIPGPHHCTTTPCQHNIAKPHHCTMLQRRVSRLAEGPNKSTAPHYQGVFPACSNLQAPLLHHAAKACFSPCPKPCITLPRRVSRLFKSPSQTTAPHCKGVFPAVLKAQIITLQYTTKACFTPVQISKANHCSFP